MFPSVSAVAPYFLFLLLCTTAAPASSHELSPRDSACALAASPPTGSTCGLRGRYTPNARGGKFLTRQFTSLATCAQFCSDASLNQSTTPCSAFLYNTVINQCVLFQRNFRSINFTEDDSSNTYIYSYGCYDCPLQCNAPPDLNLFNNPSFNLSKTRLGPWVIAATVPKLTPLDDGGTAITYNIYAQNTTNVEIVQYRYLCQDVEYLLAFDMKVDVTVPGDPSASPSDFFLQLHWFFGDCSYDGTIVADNTPLGTWRTFGCSLRAKPFSTAEFFFNAYATDLSPNYTYQLSLANMKLTQRSNGPISTTGASVLSNGDFEDATPSPWLSTSDFYTYYNYYYQDPPDQCIINGTEIPIYSLVKPGLPASSGGPPSGQAFRFCGTTPPTASYPYDPVNRVTFDFEQNIENHPFEDKLYLLSATYQTTPQDTDTYFVIQGYTSDGKTNNENLYFNPVQTLNGDLVTLQQLFYGSTIGSSTASLKLQWQAATYATYKNDDYTADPAQLEVIADNISIREVDE